MNLNPNAVITWTLFSVVGYLIHDITGALTGLAIGLTISLAASFIE